MDGNFMKTIDIKVPFIDTVEDFLQLQEQEIYNEKGIDFPVLYPKMVHKSLVEANDYNPNYVAKDKMKLLKISIEENGFCFGIISIFDYEKRKFVIVDGDHRNQITGEKWLKLNYKPLIVLNHSMDKRLAATMQFNKARGVHRIEGNAELVQRMLNEGVEEIVICKTLGIDADEFLRLKRLRKIADVYIDREFSKSWEI
ncbi:ParB-like nuclease domain-containing protein [Cruoricaptor ignavus]|uniref:ParB-like nuclease domain-containing protein n=2 Tax=Cruoricaptor ignavus TaxID=1118202 RepID=A0A1M6HBW2_9FLAO|nr:ParB-like nuclease domain-containing protein [Cruoricaptor ignavus]